MNTHVLDPNRAQNPNAAFRDSIGIDWFRMAIGGERYVAHFPLPSGGREIMRIEKLESLGIW